MWGVPAGAVGAGAQPESSGSKWQPAREAGQGGVLGGGSKAPDVKEQGLLKQLRCQRAWSMGSTGLTARVLFCVCKAREVVGDGPRRALNAWCPRQGGGAELQNKHPLQIPLRQGGSPTGLRADSGGTARCGPSGPRPTEQQPLELRSGRRTRGLGSRFPRAALVSFTQVSRSRAAVQPP